MSRGYIPGLNSARVTSDSAILFDACDGSTTSGSVDNHDKFGNILFGDGHTGNYIAILSSNDNDYAGKWFSGRHGYPSGTPSGSADTTASGYTSVTGNRANPAVN